MRAWSDRVSVKNGRSSSQLIALMTLFRVYSSTHSTVGLLGRIVIASWIILTGCVGRQIHSDYSPGKIYKFTRDMCIINTGDGLDLVEPGNGGSPKALDDAYPRGKGHYLRAFVRSGERVMIVKIGKNSFNTVGPFIWVKARILSGEANGIEVDLGYFSFSDNRTTVHSDSRLLIAE